MHSPVNTVGGSSASFPFVVVVIAVVVVLPIGAICPCPKVIIGAAWLVICIIGELPCLVMKLWIWLAILVVIVGCGGSGVNGWVPCSVTICPVATTSVALVRGSVLSDCGSCSSGV